MGKAARRNVVDRLYDSWTQRLAVPTMAEL